jgi:hypothetical protein
MLQRKIPLAAVVWLDNINSILEDGVYWIDVVQRSNWWKAPEHALMKLLVP